MARGKGTDKPQDDVARDEARVESDAENNENRENRENRDSGSGSEQNEEWWRNDSNVNGEVY